MKSSIILAAIFTVTLFTTVTAAQARADAQGQKLTPNQHMPRIQLAILLDTSNSMDGLIDQTRNQLWTMVDELSNARQNGQQPHLEVAVFEYGNDSVAARQGHVRRLTGLTTELDKVSEALFSLTTNGGSEFCGQAIATAVQQLQWSHRPGDLRLIFIAGNEPFTQGPVDYADALELARDKNIAVSTIFAGAHNEGVATGWKQGALLAGGDYMSIDHNYQVAHIDAPQDQRIAELNAQLNNTYVPYGQTGAASAERQSVQDQKSAGISSALLAKRAKAKASALYKNEQWDLVDAYESGKVDLDELEPEALPAPMAHMNQRERKALIEEKQAERKRVQQEIKTLSAERDIYLEKARKDEKAKGIQTMNDALIKSIHEQARKKAYRFE